MYEIKLEFPGEGRFNQYTFVGEAEMFSDAAHYFEKN